MNNTEINTSRTTVALAIVGFIAIVGTTMWLAVYSMRYVPAIVGRIGSAAVYLSSGVIPSPTPTLSVVLTPTASTTIPFSEASSTISTSASSTTSNLATETPAKSVQKTAGSPINNTYQIGGTATTAPYGLPDLAIIITAVGYITTPSSPADSFVESFTVPSGYRPAVKFTISNIGTNWTGTWRFSASIPTLRPTVPNPWVSDPQPSLAPGESAPYVLGFDDAITGPAQPITITANSDNAVNELKTANDSISINLNVL